jgi:hypothetical protein
MFGTIKQAVKNKAAAMQKTNSLFVAKIDRDVIWKTYLDAFPEELRQEHNCNCCKSFIRQYGGTVTFDSKFNMISVWDVEMQGVYAEPVKALAAYVKSCQIDSIFLTDSKNLGTDRNPDSKRKVIWEHFYTPISDKYVAPKDAIPTKCGTARTNQQVFLRGLREITVDACETVIELVGQNSLYRGNEYLPSVKAFLKLKKDFDKLSQNKQEAFAWTEVLNTANGAISHIKNTAIGTLLMDLSDGKKDLESSVKSFENMVAPSNYKRTTALVTQRMIDDAKKTIEDAGMIGALYRRKLDLRDLTANHALYVFRPQKATRDVFEQLKSDALVDTKTFSKVEEIHVDQFIQNVLPTAKKLRMLVENSHRSNFVTLTGPRNEGEPSIMKWDNSFGWSYTGGVADSIKEKVKQAGGKVDGCWLRASLAWHNHDDLDLHFKSAKETVYYGNKRGSLAHLDVDMNAGSGQTREPVENIYCEKQLPVGTYSICVNQYCRREDADSGFELEIEVNGEVFSLSNTSNPRSGYVEVTFTVSTDGVVTFDKNIKNQNRSFTKWGIETQKWQDVLAICNSPNFWEKPSGNLHRFFILKGCYSDEKTKPFYNEFLCPLLYEKRKVMEVLANKIEVDEAEGQELSGLGFSDTIRNHAFFEVEGQFKRVVKVLF